MQTTQTRTEVISVAGTDLEVFTGGTGGPILVLHGLYPQWSAPFIEALGPHGRVAAPVHPGFGTLPLPNWITGIDDLSYLYLDLIEQLDWRDVTVVGVSLGGWIAAEIATKCTARMAKLVLVGPLGLKVGDRETRGFPDIYAMGPNDVDKLLLFDATRAPDYAVLPDAEMLEIARAREAAVQYLWEPYMHNPQLGTRLHRIDVPTLIIRGEADGLVSDECARAYAAAIPGSSYLALPRAGHAPEFEQPGLLATEVAAFMGC